MTRSSSASSSSSTSASCGTSARSLLRPPAGRQLGVWLLVAAAAWSAVVAHAGEEAWDHLSYRGDARVRWLQVDVDGRAPAGLYGEPLAQQTSFLQRFVFELEAELNDRFSAGGLLRDSNEPDRVLRLGPDYFARPVGSAFVAFDLPRFRARLGYYRAQLTPLTLMRWDQHDIALGGSQRGCGVCGSTTAGVLVESLEEIQPELTLEGARIGGNLGPAVDWLALYGRPAEATLDVVPGVGVADRETFQYHRDLYAARVVLSRLHRSTFTFRRLGATILHFRDDPLNPGCPVLPTDELCNAEQQTAAGLDYRLPIGRQLRLEGEWLRVAYKPDRRDAAAGNRWATGYRFTGEWTLWPKHLRWEAAYLSLDEQFSAPYSAVTYRANRRGHRHRLVASWKRVEVNAFVRWMVPVGIEWLDAGGTEAKLAAERLMSLQTSAELPAGWEARVGYQHEQESLDLAAATADLYREPQRDITVAALAYAASGVEISIDQQWIWEEKRVRAQGSGMATIASIAARIAF